MAKTTHIINKNQSEDFNTFYNSAKHWLDDFGFKHFDTFTDDKLYFTPGQMYLRDTNPCSNSIYIYKNTKEELEDDADHFDRNIKSKIEELSQILILKELIETIGFSFEKLRSALLQKFPKYKSIFRFRRLLKLNDLILKHQIYIDLITTEFEQNYELLKRRKDFLSTLKGFSFSHIKGRDFKESIFYRIEGKIEIINKHLKLIREWISQYTSVRNTEISFVLAIIVLILSIIGLIFTWYTLKNPG